MPNIATAPIPIAHALNPISNAFAFINGFVIWLCSKCNESFPGKKNKTGKLIPVPVSPLLLGILVECWSLT